MLHEEHEEHEESVDEERPFGLAFASAPPINGLTLLKRVTRRPVLQKVRHHSVISPSEERESNMEL